jgi:hypothetical protein
MRFDPVKHIDAVSVSGILPRSREGTYWISLRTMLTLASEAPSLSNVAFPKMTPVSVELTLMVAVM